MKKKINYAGILKETGILTVAVAIIAAAVYFFLVPSHCLLYTSYLFSLHIRKFKIITEAY